MIAKIFNKSFEAPASSQFQVSGPTVTGSLSGGGDHPDATADIVMAASQMAAMRASLTNRTSSSRRRAEVAVIMEVPLLQGVRMHEPPHLKVADFDFHNNTITL